MAVVTPVAEEAASTVVAAASMVVLTGVDTMVAAIAEDTAEQDLTPEQALTVVAAPTEACAAAGPP
jgi:hypothetical protein